MHYIGEREGVERGLVFESLGSAVVGHVSCYRKQQSILN